MIYLIGGALRAGKSILCQRITARLGIGWTATDLLLDMLRVSNVAGIKSEWNAAPEVLSADAAWFFPYLERFVRGAHSIADDYAIEGVDFLPAQVAELAKRYPVRAVFLGCSTMTLEQFDRFPGHSRGYAMLPDALRQQFSQDVPRWSAFVRQEAERFDLPYVDTGGDFQARVGDAETLLIEDRAPG